MKNIFEPAAVSEIADRIAHLTPESERQWGRMTVAQMMAHCSVAIEMAEGKMKPPRLLIGRVLGPLAKRAMIGKGEPMRRNAMADSSVIVADERDFATEQRRLRASIDRFATGGPESCTAHPHFFFGRLTPEEWGALTYQHLDHHLRQFGA